jgi:quercetin dioxygenase-like cupin family protein
VITLNIEKQGESITFLAEADSTAQRAENEVRLAPGASGPPPHRHTKQREFFHVVSGSMIVIVEGKEHRAATGEMMVVEPGQVHTFANGSESDPLIIRGAVEPALHFQWFLSEMAKAAIRAGGSWRDVPLLEVGFLLYHVRDEYRLGGMPIFVQDLLFGALAWIAILVGRTKYIQPKEGSSHGPSSEARSSLTRS